MRRNFQDLIKNPPANAQREQKPKQPAVVQVAEWNKALEYLDAGDINKAYEEILISEDDLYLLRLMTITGPCVNKLNQKVAFQLHQKIKLLMKSEFWKVLALQMLGNLSSKQECLRIEQKQKLQQLLYQWSKSWQPQISKETVLLYNSGVFKPDHII
ncbi:unnamed protein product (macronuclear) [Paramecium tetraurelia]|uniref:TORTIFOLIA1/TORL1-2 C-terminal domain-containing protein n=2 Tax=Paramecium TaxID=5884 RepID=A0CCM1_PARTE|nr:uncharacterized protein GSPATT00037323001 [Paramecium tetraurelia]CAD8162015.1 unnamed protein product [Paramecium octaurelia]CAK68538.1 unnamed protein product [Paramecium tetraurelia]|eukprot:XP_001435935.1 hypothetical protein (macronuclear) [Paramecium tetraurelia strain d4-2]